MTIKYSNRRSSSKSKYTLDDRSLKIKIFILVILMLTLTVNVIPIAAVSKPGDAYNDPGFQTASTLIFKAEADARVEESNPTTNAGTSDYLEVISENNRSIESYVRFTVSGISGVIQDARLRVYSTTETSMNGPAVYPADNNWTETGITWNNRPPHLGDAGHAGGLHRDQDHRLVQDLVVAEVGVAGAAEDLGSPYDDRPHGHLSRSLCLPGLLQRHPHEVLIRCHHLTLTIVQHSARRARCSAAAWLFDTLLLPKANRVE